MLSMNDIVDFWNCECSLEKSSKKKAVDDDSDLLWNARHAPLNPSPPRKVVTVKAGKPKPLRKT